MHLSARARAIRPSVTIAIDSRAKELRAAGEHVINLSAGEPDFPTPDFIKQAGIAAIEQDFTRYTPAAGIRELREAIAAKHERTTASATTGTRSWSPAAASTPCSTPSWPSATPATR